MDDLHCDEIKIEKLNLSVRSNNALRRAGINTLTQLFNVYMQQKLPEIRNLGIKSYQEIKDVLDKISKEGLNIEKDVDVDEITDVYVVPEEIEDISIYDLKLSERLSHSLIKEGFDTIGKIMHLTKDDILTIHGIGNKSKDELLTIIKSIKEEGADYFNNSEDASHKLRPLDEQHKRTIDIETVNKLRVNYHFRTAWLSEWYGVTRSRINQILHKKINRGNWLNRKLSDEDIGLFLKIVSEGKNFVESDNGTKAYFLNNKEDDCAFIIVNDNEIKCFFLEILPKNLQQIIHDKRLECLSFEELHMINSGKTEMILKKEYFIPNNASKFQQYANDRGMTVEEYCSFLTGKGYLNAHLTINDEKIIRFLNEHYINGMLIIPSNYSTHWFRSFIFKNGYNIDEIAELYGFKEKLNQEDEAQRLDTIEDDMKNHNISSRDWLERIYSESPLIGNMLILKKEEEELLSIAKNQIDQRLNYLVSKFDLKTEMQIALAVIIYAKDWDTGDESGFWRYITSQFGYRDEAGQLRGILCECVLNAMQKNQRWFFTSAAGYQYKSTIVIHALATKRSWMYLYDFLFDFYKTNMEWTYIENDSIVPKMVFALRGKLITGDETENENLKISDKVYSFQEGIRKLIIYRTGYAVKLIFRMLGRINDIINHIEKPAEFYIDILCNQWFECKLKSAQGLEDHGGPLAVRNVAIDYTRIRPQYVLEGETTPVIRFPDIRLKKSDYNRIKIKVYVEDDAIEDRVLSFYGNELGKTLNGFSIDINKCLLKGNGTLNIRIILSCENELIYDSGKSLYRECLCFLKVKECDIRETVKGSYSIFAPIERKFEFSGAEVSDIDAGTWWKAYFVRLEQDFLVKMDGQIMSYDDSDEELSDGVRVIAPFTNQVLSFVKNGHHYNIISKKADFLIVAHELRDFRKYIVMMNNKKIEFGNINSETSENNVVYTIPMDFNNENICEFHVVDFVKNRIISRCLFKFISGINARFDKEFYFTETDYINAFVDIGGIKRQKFGLNDELISLPKDDGVVEIKIPRVTIHDSTGKRWKIGETLWIKDIRQDEKIYISYPLGVSVSLKVGNIDVTEEQPGKFDIGNGVYAYSDPDISAWAEINLSLKGKYSASEYKIGSISKIERFLGPIIFNYHDNNLYWNRGIDFLGNKNDSFILRIATDGGLKKYPLYLEDEIAIRNPELSLGEYDYQIIKNSENIFLDNETVLAQGSLVIGDADALRFDRSMIQITRITFEEKGILQNVDIRDTYIDQIEYKGIKLVCSEDRKCPVYQGVMFYMGQSGNHHEFSTERIIPEKGYQLYKINPVQIVYINEHTLSITDEDGDGIYYYRYFNKFTMENSYAITDREPTPHNENMYYLADLYTYRKVRTQ